MQKFAIFPALMGSDQLLPLDGRWNYDSIRAACIKQASRLRNLHNSKILRAEIYNRGISLSSSHKIYEILWDEEDIKYYN